MFVLFLQSKIPVGIKSGNYNKVRTADGAQVKVRIQSWV